MRKLLIISAVAAMGAGAIAGASQAGLNLPFMQSQKVTSAESSSPARYGMENCRVEKTLKYDYQGNPYLKKVRICA